MESLERDLSESQDFKFTTITGSGQFGEDAKANSLSSPISPCNNLEVCTCLIIKFNKIFQAFIITG